MSISKVDMGKDESPKPRPRNGGAKPVDLADAEGEEDCAICLTRMENTGGGRAAAQLPCSHIFHEECVGKWLLGHQTCPTCRAATWVEAECVHEEEPEDPPGDVTRPDPDDDDDRMLLDMFPHWLLYPV